MDIKVPTKTAKGHIGIDLTFATWSKAALVKRVDEDSMAQRAGLQVGQTILTVNGVRVHGATREGSNPEPEASLTPLSRRSFPNPAHYASWTGGVWWQGARHASKAISDYEGGVLVCPRWASNLLGRSPSFTPFWFHTLGRSPSFPLLHRSGFRPRPCPLAD